MSATAQALTQAHRRRSEIMRLLRVFLRFEKLLIPHWRHFLLLLLLGQAFAFSLVYCASSGGRLLDTLIEGDRHGFRLWWIGTFVGQIGMAITQTLQGIVQAYLVQRVLLTLQFRLFRHVSRQSVMFHASRPIGEHMYRITQDPYSGVLIICAAIPQIVILLQQLLTSLGAVRALDWRATVALAVYFVVYVTYAHWLSGAVRQFLHNQRRAAQENTAVLQESLAGIRPVLAFGRERFERLKFFHTLVTLYRRNLAFLSMSAFYGSSSQLLDRLFNCIVIWVLAGWMVIRGVFTPGQWFTLALLLAQLSFSLQAAILFIQTIRIQLVLAERMLETLDVQPEVQDAPDAMDIPPVKGRIEFRNVRFGYVPGKEVLRGVGFSIEPGSFVVLTGSAASGKSTVLNLIERFHDPDSGEVLIDGQNVRNVTQRSLRKNIGLAFQEPLLCSGTILQNFRYGAPHASLDEVRKVAHVVDLDSFIESLEKGYDTPVSEAGNLSGGQKQRLALGRTLLSNAPILLLDQPTSALDAKTEETVIRRLREFVRGKTVLMVTHSLRNARVADRILLFDEGQLVAQGTHDQLLASSLLYAQMWATEGDSREQGD